MKTYLILASLIAFFGCTSPERAQKIAIIPQPVEMRFNDGEFVLSRNTKLFYTDTTLSQEATVIAKLLNVKMGGFTTDEENKAITLKVWKGGKSEGYKIRVTPSAIEIEATDYNGAYYAALTLSQMVPLTPAERYAIPAIEIEDYPRFEWRGMHLDCSRHFFNASDVKKYIDYLSMHKLNRFHWHLTDDQGWRMESKKYPLLTEISAWRVDRSADDWANREPQKEGEKTTYGGFFTQDEIREVVRYAAERGVTIIPEVDVPGHSSAIFASYPNLSCLGVKQNVTPGGYYPPDMATCFCAGNDDVFVFLEGIFDEVLELFPNAAYIHIGGDEVVKRFWRNCPKCKKRMADEKLKDLDELQSYFVKRITAYIRSKGRDVIGWDEILEGGLPQSAAVMNWRAVGYGIQAVQMGHKVVMTPNSHLYFDYYQNNPDVEPKSIGNFITMKKVYGFEPVPEGLTDEQQKLILGVQANLWAEFIPDFKHVEYMVLPRMCALAEVAWSPKTSRNWDDFSSRVAVQQKRFEAMGANAHKGADFIDFVTTYDSTRHVFSVTMGTEIYGSDIFYTTDGTEPTLNSPKYLQPLELTHSVNLRAILAKENVVLSKKPTERTIGMHKGVGKKIKYISQVSPSYKGSGERTLLDGFTGYTSHSDGLMQGFSSCNFDVEIDMGKTEEITELNLSCFQSIGTWIYLPTEVIFYKSENGKEWEKTDVIQNPLDKETDQIRKVFTSNKKFSARYVKIVAVNGVTPQGLPGAGGINWIFVDEIIIK